MSDTPPVMDGADLDDSPVTSVLTQTISRLMLAPSVMIGVAILVKGYADTGDGFSAGVVLALGVLLQFIAFGQASMREIPLVRYAPYGAFLGLLLALGVAFTPTLLGEPIMTHFPGADAHVIHFGTLEILTAVLFDIGVCLLVFGFSVGITTLIARSSALMITAERPDGANHSPVAHPRHAPVDPMTQRDAQP